MPYQNEVRPLNLFGDFLAGKQAAIDSQGAQQANALRGLQVQRAQGLNALAGNPAATPEQYIRAGDAPTGSALSNFQDKQTADKQQALGQVAGLAQKALTITDPVQRKAFLQQATPAYADAFAAIGADHNKGMAELQGLPDAELEQRLQRVAQFAAPQKPIELAPGASLVTPPATLGGAFTNAFTAPPAPMSPYQAAEAARANAALAETNRHNKATEGANNPFLAGGAPNAGGGPSGADFLKSIPPNLASQVKALAEGRMAFPAGMALKSPYWQQMLTAVSQYDPNFDAVNYNARAKTRSDFTSGKNAQNIKALNTAIGHLGRLEEQIGGTASHSFTPLNIAQNVGEEVFGSSGQTNFKQTASALATELTAVFRGSGGAEADVARYLSQLNVNGSQEQKKGAVNNIVELLNARLSAIGDQYNQGMGTTEDPLTLLNPKAQAVIARLSGAQQTDAASVSHPSGAAAPNAGWTVKKVP